MTGSETSRNPFPGLRSFESHEDYLFFGREGQAEELLKRLRRSRFVAVVGTSGSGKSSLVKAELLPALHGGLMAGPGKNWRVGLFRPGDNPIKELATALNRPGVLWEGDVDEEEAMIRGAFIEASLRRSSRGLVKAVAKARMPADENLLLVVDQFEELFRFRRASDQNLSPDESASFVKLLLAAGKAPSPPVYIVITMRSDFLGDCAKFRDLPETINDGQYLIPRMTREQKRRAIEGPAAVYRANLAPRLVQHLLNDVGDNPDQLPILQHVLMRIWDNWKAGGTEFPDLSDYEAVGKMKTALSRHADEVYWELPDKRSRTIAEKIFKTITSMGPGRRGIRSPVSLKQLSAITETGKSELIPVIEAFRSPGRSFLAPPAGVALSEDSILDISHESLMRIWNRMDRWVREEASSARRYARLAETAMLFAQKEAGLLRDPGLQLTLDWREQSRPSEAWAKRYHAEFALSMEFLDASQKARDDEIARQKELRRLELDRTRALAEERRMRLAQQEVAAKRLKTMILAVTVFLIISIILGLHSFIQLKEVEKARDAAEKAQKVSRSHELSAFASLELERDPVLSFRLAEAAINEWPTLAAQRALLPTLEHSFNNILQGHGDKVSDAVFSPDGKTVATASLDRTARIWDAGEGKLLKVLEGRAWGIHGVSFSPDGKRLVAASADGSARIWDIREGKVETVLTGHTQKLHGASFSPDGKRIVTASADGTARIWDAKEGKGLRVLEKHMDEVTSASFSPDGQLVVTASDDDTALIWDAEKGRVRQVLSGHTECVKDAVFSPDGRFVVTASEDNTARIWDADSGKTVRVLKGHTGDVTSASFSPDGKHILTSSRDHTARIWDSENGLSERALKGHKWAVTGAVFSPDGGRVVTASEDRTVRIWHIEQPRVLKGHTAPVTSATFSPDGKSVVTAARDSTVRIWDAKKGKVRHIFPVPHADFDTNRAFSPDGKRIVTPSCDNTACIWDVARGEKVTLLEGHEGQVNSVAFSPGGKRVVTGSMDKTALIWNAEDGKTLYHLYGHTWSVTDAGFSPDGKRVVTASMDDTVRIWNSRNGKLLHILHAGAGLGNVNAAYSPRGGIVVTSSLGDTGAGIWDVNTGTRIRELKSHAATINGAVFSADGRYIVTASMDRTARIWDADGYRELHVLRGHTGGVTQAAFSPDSRYVVTASGDHTVRIWDAEKGETLHRLRGHTDIVAQASFSPGGGRVLTASMDGTVRIWAMDHREILNDINIERTRGKVREFTEEELERYGFN
ncbi:MAG: hypothetical protein GY737_09340 [Desulfobacteraceae bacterium]|nr:hypothetical protein [Desulfobacteraceae bacterium]